MLLKAIGQFPFITEKISEQALVKATLVLLPRPLQKSAGTLGPGLAIQRGDRMCMFRAWRRVGNSSGSLTIFTAIICASSHKLPETKDGWWCFEREVEQRCMTLSIIYLGSFGTGADSEKKCAVSILNYHCLHPACAGWQIGNLPSAPTLTPNHKCPRDRPRRRSSARLAQEAEDAGSLIFSP